MPPGNIATHNDVPTNITQTIGVQYFQQVVITWSIRNRGRVQRTHIMIETPMTALNRMFATPIRLPT